MKTVSLFAAVFVLSASAALAAEPDLLTLPDGHPLVEGMLSKTAIHQVMFIHRQEIRECYDAGLKRKPGIAGKIVAQFVIEVTGSVSHVRITGSTLNDSMVENCILNHVARWRFPRPARGRVAVTYPWMLDKKANG